MNKLGFGAMVLEVALSGFKCIVFYIDSTLGRWAAPGRWGSRVRGAGAEADHRAWARIQTRSV